MNDCHASITRHSVVAVDGTRELPGTAFWRRVNALADAIEARPERRYALVCEDTAWFAAGLLALVASGRTTVVPQAPRGGSLADSGAGAEVVLTDRPDAFAGFDVLAVSEPVAATPNRLRQLPDEARIEFYTSGSGGTPKCIVKRFGQLRLENEALEREWGDVLGDAVVVGAVPHYHMYGVNVRILWPILAGRPFVTGFWPNPPDIKAAVGGRDCIITASPAFLSRIDDVADMPAAERVKAVFSAGAPLSVETARHLARDWGCAVTEIYGCTEGGGIAWRSWSSASGHDLWQPLRSVEVAFRPENAGDQLWVRSAYTDGGGWLATGDLAHGESDGRFRLLGRADDVVKVEDKRVSLAQMQERLRRHAWVGDARLLLIPGRREVIGAVVVLNADARVGLDREGKLEVRRRLGNWLAASYENVLLPRKWRFPPAWPEDELSKVGHRWLLGLFNE